MRNDARAVLAERARVLALPLSALDDGTGAANEQVLIFRIGDTTLGVTMESVVAIVRAGMVTPLPRAQRPIFGIAAWRGRPLTVLMLDSRLPATDSTQFLIVLGDGRRAAAGVLVDEIEDTRSLDRDALSESGSGPLSTFAIGITNDALLVLDAAQILRAARSDR